jgi:hypothetical protein
VNTDNTTHSPDTRWQILGELELPAGASMEDTLYTWLTEVLHPLHLQAGLLNQVIVSAQEAVARAAQTGIVEKFEHIHLMVLVPIRRKRKERAWGFFRLEKIENAKAPQTTGDHAVEFYLYGEGD